MRPELYTLLSPQHLFCNPVPVLPEIRSKILLPESVHPHLPVHASSLRHTPRRSSSLLRQEFPVSRMQTQIRSNCLKVPVLQSLTTGLPPAHRSYFPLSGSHSSVCRSGSQLPDILYLLPEDCFHFLIYNMESVLSYKEAESLLSHPLTALSQNNPPDLRYEMSYASSSAHLSIHSLPLKSYIIVYTPCAHLHFCSCFFFHHHTTTFPQSKAYIRTFLPPHCLQNPAK